MLVTCTNVGFTSYEFEISLTKTFLPTPQYNKAKIDFCLGSMNEKFHFTLDNSQILLLCVSSTEKLNYLVKNS